MQLNTLTCTIPLPVELRSSASMATVQLQTLTLTRSSALPSAALSPPVAVSGHRSSAALPRYSGLRIRPAAENGFVSRGGSRTAPRAGRVMCEARDTAVEGQVSISLLRFSVSFVMLWFY